LRAKAFGFMVFFHIVEAKMRPALMCIEGGCRAALQKDVENVLFKLIHKHKSRFLNHLSIHQADSLEGLPEISLLEAIPVGPFARNGRPQFHTLVSVVPEVSTGAGGERQIRCTIYDGSFENDILDELFALAARYGVARIVTTKG
jgi:hypothetical protein